MRDGAAQLRPVVSEPGRLAAAFERGRALTCYLPLVGEYLFDCTNFRTDDKDDLLRQVYEMTDKRFRLAEHLLETKPWELFAMVEIGLDRMHHGFWKDLDEHHRRHDPTAATPTRSSTTCGISTG